MKELYCNPIVFTVEDDYMIGIMTNEKGIIYVEINGQKYRAERSGTLCTNATHALIRVSGEELRKYKKYSVCFRSCPERQMAFTKVGEIQSKEYNFRPVLKEEDLHIYMCSDIHRDYEYANKCVSYFDDTDFLVINGDTTELRTEDDFKGAYKFLGDFAKGEIPVLFIRGNHDTRGAIADRFGEFYPTVEGRCYYGFNTPTIEGIVVECGEDKWDSSIEYGGVNDFQTYRKTETEFLKKFSMTSENKWRICFTHICPNATTLDLGDIFDIERDTYADWTKELERMKIDCMFCAHIHEFGVTLKDNSKSTLKETLPHNYPIFTGSRRTKWENLENLTPAQKASRHFATYLSGGCAIILGKDIMNIKFVDEEKNTVEEYEIRRNDLNSFKKIK